MNEGKRVATIFTTREQARDFCTALRLEALEHVSERVSKCERQQQGETLYVVVADTRRELGEALEHVPQPHTQAYFKTDRARTGFVVNLPDNGFEICHVGHLNDIIQLSEEERLRVQERVFAVANANPVRQILMFNPENFMQLMLRESLEHPQPRPPPPQPSGQFPKEWRKRLQPDQVEPAAAVEAKDDECVICADGNKRTVLFVPCDHLVACDACATAWMEQNPTCPICREPVEDVRRIKK